ncbi:3-hydroxyacyl-CoA dehydrogenase family protein [Mycobacterium sp. CBMA293]|nr:3-hydroxyacyl-CoA dehydrogenase family protein [Mycolicibacterium sp. CBMA 360]MUL61271.1 3-hydroxyacyl-CoA dehydrogenase family protein [Mycolicibacterium sp. CBMA 335]MUL72006.1 3-hydroxyacyl-CoA dehydrogenase family protein [Mycolicibacterium sp. CBMA 311]MUL96173.1 3-hydroxyacyl-CoA dehydrogenase family protein [Mycolicibacterium sp. CBMA 230]MUM06703.1 3-hydroxybutyryl-CoA dehydrogenase [Mycolicibacterium sp. CBMA 213]MUM13483.1 3-hydroxyacyl-CoA dehydrogenase family protein [Mycolicib
MGAGIAHAFAVSGAHVMVIENDDPAAAAARERIEKSIAKAAEKGIPATGTVTVTTDPAALTAAGLVIEAVPELADLKRTVLATIASAAPAAAIGTNTSSLSIDNLADAVPDPGRVIGLHFFNPVPVSDLVEIVVGARTDQTLVTLAAEWVAALGKTAITVTDSPGFASSRLGVAIALEAMRMLDEGVASAHDIDTAMTLGYRHPVGPLKTTDIVGLDVRLNIAEHLERELGARFAPPKVLRDKVAAGHLGRKTGQGFYTW